MNTAVYNTLTMILLYGGLTALGLAAVYGIAAIWGWRGPYRKRRLVTAALLFVTFPICVLVQQTLLFKMYLPSVGESILREAIQLREASSIAHVGDQAPLLNLADADGNPFVLEDLRGKVVVVNYFATSCGPCLRELPHIQEMWNQHRENPQFALIVIGVEETTETVRKFKAKYRYTFPMAPDPDCAAYALYAALGIPRTYVIERDGRISLAIVGSDETKLQLLKTEVASQLLTQSQ